EPHRRRLQQPAAAHRARPAALREARIRGGRREVPGGVAAVRLHSPGVVPSRNPHPAGRRAGASAGARDAAGDPGGRSQLASRHGGRGSARRRGLLRCLARAASGGGRVELLPRRGPDRPERPLRGADRLRAHPRALHAPQHRSGGGRSRGAHRRALAERPRRRLRGSADRRSALRALSVPAASSSRIRAVDWLRGLAVLFMIQTHALALLKPALRSGRGFDALQWVDGLVAPSFILAAGFSMGLTQVRAAAAPGAADARRRRMRRTLRRLGEVLGVGVLVNWMWFPIFRQPRWIVRMDILPCIGISLLVALPILFLLAPRPRALRWAALLLAAVVFAVAPYAEAAGPPWDRFLNGHADAVFPLLPWAGYVYLGAAVGAAAA